MNESSTDKTPKIYHKDILDRMSRVEGEDWRRLQTDRRTSPYGFFTYLEAWKIIRNDKELEGFTPAALINAGMLAGVPPGDGAIYGEGGYTRYYVSADGTVCFDYEMAREDKQAKALAEGFPPG